VPVNRREVEREIGLKLSRDPLMRRQAREEAEDIRDYAKDIAPKPGDVHPQSRTGISYATGDFVESIHLERRRDRFDLPRWWLGSNHPHVNLLEWGTGPDKPGSRSPFGSDTPTPEFGTFGRTAHHFGGSMP
jgi:hypothetical protein